MPCPYADACHTNTRDESESHPQGLLWSSTFKASFCLFGKPGAEGTNYGTRGTCRLANKDKQGFLGWTSNILNALVFPSLSVAEWWLSSCSSLLFSGCQWTNCGLCPPRGQNPSCSNNCKGLLPFTRCSCIWLEAGKPRSSCLILRLLQDVLSLTH